MSSSPRASMIVMPWSPSGPDTITASPGQAAVALERDGPLEDADPGGGDVAAVGLAALDDLGVAGDDLHPGDGGRARHRVGDPPQVGDREALLEDEPGREVQRPRPAHREVVDGAVDREVADVAAGEEQRRDDVRVGGERQPRPAHRPATPRPRAVRGPDCGTPRRTRASMRVWVALPPAPCASVIRSSRTRGRRRRARSMRSRTCSSLRRCSAPACVATASSAQPAWTVGARGDAVRAHRRTTGSASIVVPPARTRSRLKRPKL